MEPTPDEIVQHARDCLAESERNEQHRLELSERVAEIPGPLGALLRTICVMHADWLQAEQLGCVTDAESRRMEQIVDDAVEFEAWLRSAQ